MFSEAVVRNLRWDLADLWRPSLELSETEEKFKTVSGTKSFFLQLMAVENFRGSEKKLTDKCSRSSQAAALKLGTGDDCKEAV